MRSNSISTPRPCECINDVVRPRAETESGTCHQWLVIGSKASRTLPTTCVHMWKVSRVSSHDERVRSGHIESLFRRADSSRSRLSTRMPKIAVRDACSVGDGGVRAGLEVL